MSDVAARVVDDLHRRAILALDLFHRIAEGRSFVHRAAFIKGIRAAGIALSTADALSLFALMDADGDDRVSWEHFEEVLVAHVAPTHLNAPPRSFAAVAHWEEDHHVGFSVNTHSAPIPDVFAPPPPVPQRRGELPSDGVKHAVRKLRAAAYVEHGVDLESLFVKMDVNHDGGVSLVELRTGLRKAGVLTRELSDDEVAALFWAIDVDHDGEISPVEFTDFIRAHAAATGVVFAEAHAAPVYRHRTTASFSASGLPLVRTKPRTLEERLAEPIEKFTLRRLRETGVHVSDLFRDAAHDGEHVHVMGLKRGLEQHHIFLGLTEAKTLFTTLDVAREGQLNYVQFNALYGKWGTATTPPVHTKVARSAVAIAAAQLIASASTTGGVDFHELFRHLTTSSVDFKRGKWKGEALPRSDFTRAVLKMQASRDISIRLNAEQVGKLFNAVDVDKDGAITEKELTDFVRRIAARDGLDFRERKQLSPRSRHRPHMRAPKTGSTTPEKAMTEHATHTKHLATAHNDTPQHRVARRVMHDLRIRACALSDVFHRGADGDDDISRTQMKKGFHSCGVMLDDTDSLLLFSLLDWDGDGRVQWDEFEQLNKPRKLGASPAARRAVTMEREKLGDIVRKLIALAYTAGGVCLELLFHHLDMRRRGKLKFSDFSRGVRRAHAAKHSTKDDGHHHGGLTDGEALFLFHCVDADGDGDISVDEFTHFIRLAAKEDGFEFKEVSAEVSLRLSQPTENNPVHNLVRKLRAAAHVAGGANIAALFRHKDEDGDGALSHNEFRRTLRAAKVTHEQFADDAIVELFAEVDHDDSGSIQLDEFLEFARLVGDAPTPRAQYVPGRVWKSESALASFRNSPPRPPFYTTSPTVYFPSAAELPAPGDVENELAMSRSRSFSRSPTASVRASPKLAAAKRTLLPGGATRAKLVASGGVVLPGEEGAAQVAGSGGVRLEDKGDGPPHAMWQPFIDSIRTPFVASLPGGNTWQWDLPVVRAPGATTSGEERAERFTAMLSSTSSESGSVDPVATAAAPIAPATATDAVAATRFTAAQGERGFFVYSEHWLAQGAGELRAVCDTLLKQRPVMSTGLAKGERIAVKRDRVIKPLREPLATDDYLHWWVVVWDQRDAKDAVAEGAAAAAAAVAAAASMAAEQKPVLRTTARRASRAASRSPSTTKALSGSGTKVERDGDALLSPQRLRSGRPLRSASRSASRSPMPRRAAWSIHQTTSLHTAQGLTAEERRLGYRRSPQGGRVGLIRKSPGKDHARVSERLQRGGGRSRSQPEPRRLDVTSPPGSMLREGLRSAAPAVRPPAAAPAWTSPARSDPNWGQKCTRDNVAAPDEFWAAMKEIEASLSK